MKRIPEEQCREWLKELGIPDPEGEMPPGWAKYAFPLPESSSKRAWLSSRVCSPLADGEDVLVWFRDWPFAQEQERAVLESVGCSEESRISLIKSPGFLFTASQAHVARGLFELGCLLWIDTLIADAGGRIAGFVSHHEVAVIIGRDRSTLDQLRHDFAEGGVLPLDT